MASANAGAIVPLLALGEASAAPAADPALPARAEEAVAPAEVAELQSRVGLRSRVVEEQRKRNSRGHVCVKFSAGQIACL